MLHKFQRVAHSACFVKRRDRPQELDRPEATEISNTANASAASFSPDSKSVVFTQASGLITRLSLADHQRAVLAQSADIEARVAWVSTDIVYSRGGALWRLCGFLARRGRETVLYSFTHGADGANPAAGLIRAQGNLYGTTFWGGVYDYGTVFELSSTGQETVLYGFTGGNDGGNSGAGLIRDAQGNLYGTAESGGDMSSCDGLGCGVVFKLSSTGQETVLHSFTGGADGAIPYAGLIRDAQGNLYGTTGYGGDMSSCSGNGCGVVFKLSSTGKETVLYRFKGGADGAGPTAGVIRDAQGNLHGTTWGGGAYGKGTVFELSPTGKETVLHSFAGADGANPEAGVIEDTNGNLYGTTSFGSAYSNGVVFELKP